MVLNFILFITHIIYTYNSIVNDNQNANQRNLAEIQIEHINTGIIPSPVLKIFKNEYYPLEIGTPNNDILSSLSFTHNGKLMKDILIVDEVDGEHISNSRYERLDVCLQNFNNCEDEKVDNAIIKCKLTKNPLSYKISTFETNYFDNIIYPLNYWIIRIVSSNVIPFKMDIDKNLIKDSNPYEISHEFSKYLVTKDYTGQAYLFLASESGFQQVFIDEKEDYIKINNGSSYYYPYYKGITKKIMAYNNAYFFLINSILYYMNDSTADCHEIDTSVDDFLLNKNSILVIKSDEISTNLNLYVYENYDGYELNLLENKTYSMSGTYLTMDYIYAQNNENNYPNSNYYYIVVCTQKGFTGYYELFYFSSFSSYGNKFISINKGKIHFGQIINDYNILINSYKGTLYYFIGDDSNILKQIDIYHLNDLGNKRFDFTSVSFDNDSQESILISANNYIIPSTNNEKAIFIYNADKSFIINYISNYVQELKCLFKEEGIYEQLYNTYSDCSNVTSAKKCVYDKKLTFHVEERDDQWFSDVYKRICWAILGMSVGLVVLLIVGIILYCCCFRKKGKKNGKEFKNESEQEKLQNENGNEEN